MFGCYLLPNWWGLKHCAASSDCSKLRLSSIHERIKALSTRTSVFVFTILAFFFAVRPYVHTLTAFRKLRGEDFQETVIQKNSFLWLVLLVCPQHLFMRPFLLTQLRINGRQTQNSGSFNLSSRTFHMCPDKSTSTLPLH